MDENRLDLEKVDATDTIVLAVGWWVSEMKLQQFTFLLKWTTAVLEHVLVIRSVNYFASLDLLIVVQANVIIIVPLFILVTLKEAIVIVDCY